MKLVDPKMSLDIIKSYIEVWDCDGCLTDGGTQHNVMAVDDLQYLPTIEAEPVRHGHWIILEPYGAHRTHRRKCSECGEIKAKELTNFCPDCGADMRQGAKCDESS